MAVIDAVFKKRDVLILVDDDDKEIIGFSNSPSYRVDKYNTKDISRLRNYVISNEKLWKLLDINLLN